MIGQFRLPDPPPSLRERILTGARTAPRSARRLAPLAGLAAAAVLLAGVLWIILTNPGAAPGRGNQDPAPDELRYQVVRSADNQYYTIEFSHLRGGKDPLQKLSMSTVAGKWASSHVGATVKGCVLPELPTKETDPDPKLEERTILESGVLVCFRGQAGRDGAIEVDLRYYSVENRSVAWSIIEAVTLKDREQRITKVHR